ncbi:unnamed protein product [Urochloa humidicola]
MARLAEALVVVVAMAAATASMPGAEALGLNWDTHASHPLPPKVVVHVLKKLKLFDTDFATMSVLAGSGIEVMVAIPNNMLADPTNDASKAKDWVKHNIKRYHFDGGVTINMISMFNRKPYTKAAQEHFIGMVFASTQLKENIGKCYKV